MPLDMTVRVVGPHLDFRFGILERSLVPHQGFVFGNEAPAISFFVESVQIRVVE